MTNIGVKKVNCMFNEGFNKNLEFQIGDKITKSLLAVSKLAQSGAGVWFGPAPAYESHIVWDPDAFVASSGPKTEIILKNGTYHLPINEIFRDNNIDMPQINGAEDGDDVLYSPTSPAEDPVDEPVEAQSGQGEFWPPDQAARHDPYGVPESGLGSRDLEDSRGPIVEEHIELAAENPPVRVIKSPNQPSQEDIDRHNASGHVPFRSWCPVCVEASAKDAPHTSTEGPKHDFPVFSSDYAFMGTKDKQYNITLYTVCEHRRSSVFSIVVPRKGTSETDIAIQYMLGRMHC